MQLNRYKLDELREGMQESIEHTVTHDEIKAFTDLVSDYHPLHNDDDYAKDNGFNGIIAQGFFVASLASSLVSMRLPGENTLILSNKFRYHKPVYPDDKLNIKGEIKSIDDRFALVVIEIDISVNDQRVSVGEITIKVRH